MTMGKLAYHVHLIDDDGDEHVFGPEDTVPAWAKKKITNRSAWADGDESDDDSDEAPDYSKMRKADLEAEVAKRNESRDGDAQIVVDEPGRVAELVDALEADDAAAAGD